MNSDTRFPRLFIMIVDYILPLPLTVLMYVLWLARTGEAWFSAYTLALGIAFGYILPGIGTNLLGRGMMVSSFPPTTLGVLFRW